MCSNVPHAMASGILRGAGATQLRQPDDLAGLIACGCRGHMLALNIDSFAHHQDCVIPDATIEAADQPQPMQVRSRRTLHRGAVGPGDGDLVGR